jgi:diacylglycerol O-acyltransferase
MTSRQRISHVDTAWLRMDRPENLMQILGVMVFKGRVDAERFKRTVARRMLRYRRFRQIATEDADAWWWVDDPDFDIDAHVRHSFLPAPCGTHELQKFVAEMASTLHSIRHGRAGNSTSSTWPTAIPHWSFASTMRLAMASPCLASSTR